VFCFILTRRSDSLQEQVQLPRNTLPAGFSSLQGELRCRLRFLGTATAQQKLGQCCAGHGQQSGRAVGLVQGNSLTEFVLGSIEHALLRGQLRSLGM